MKSYAPPMKRPRKALQSRAFSGVKCSRPTPVFPHIAALLLPPCGMGTGRGAVPLPPVREESPAAHRAGPGFRHGLHGQRPFQHGVKWQHRRTEIAAISARPAFPQHIALAIQRQTAKVWGRHSPTRFPQGQNERKANFGTAVESCSEKLPLSSAADFAAIYKGRCGCFRQYSDCGGVSCPPLFPSTDRNGKCQTLIWIFHHYYGRQAHFGQTSPSLTTTRERGVLPKMGAKNATDFQKSVALLFGAVFNFSLPFPLLGKRKGQPILAVL